MSKTIPELEEEVVQASAALARAKQALQEAKIAASGISVGDIVVSTLDHKEYKVVSAHVWTYATLVHPLYEKPWLVGVAKRKDGSWGRQERNLYSKWSLPSPPSGETE